MAACVDRVCGGTTGSEWPWPGRSRIGARAAARDAGGGL